VPIVVDDERGTREFVANDANVEQITERAWRRQQLRRALTTIPNEQRVCLELAYFEGLTQREIASHVETSLGTVKTRMRLGLEKLERILRAAGLTAEDAAS
jgi:RNA polymerase sigma-70 factor (ECF subfamily)